MEFFRLRCNHRVRLYACHDTFEQRSYPASKCSCFRHSHISSVCITFITVRSRFFEKLIKSRPSLLFYRGEFLEEKLKAQKVSKSEIFAAVRNKGFARFEEVEAVALETDGSFSVITALDPQQSSSALADVDK